MIETYKIMQGVNKGVDRGVFYSLHGTIELGDIY